jgi:AcrR family transcriptional regulator
MELQTEKLDKKEQIMDAAQALFAAQGYEGTSVRDICQQAGVNVAMVNYYFGSKEGLFEKMVEHKASFMRGTLEELLGNTKLTPIEKVDHIIGIFVERMFSHRDFTLTVSREMSKSNRQPVHGMMAAVFFRNMSLLKQIIEEGIRTRQFRKVDTDLCIPTIYGTISNLISAELMLKMIDPDLNATENLYDDPAFRTRVITHLRSVMRHHLLKESA